MSSSNALPLSIVVPSRNDEDWRMASLKAGIEGLLNQARRFDLRAEILLVEWNPPADRPGLRSLFDWPQGGPCRVRILTVPAELHRRFPHADKAPFLPMQSWNAGIRRATSDFVLSMTADVLYSDALVRFLAQGNLDPQAVYRVDRTDVQRRVLEAASHEGRLASCEQSILRVSGRHRHFFDPKLGIPHLHVGGVGEFLLMSRSRWQALRGWPNFICGEDVVLCYMANLQGAREIVLEPPMRVFHIDHVGTVGRLRVPFSHLLLPAWLRLKELLPRPLRRRYSLWQDRRYQSQGRWARLGVPYGTLADIENILTGMYAGTLPPPANPEDWGLGGVDLPEVTVV